MHHPTDRITHTTAFVTPVVEQWLEREIAQWVYHMKDRTMSERSTSELRPAHMVNKDQHSVLSQDNSFSATASVGIAYWVFLQVLQCIESNAPLACQVFFFFYKASNGLP